MSNFHIDVTGTRSNPTVKIIPDAEGVSDNPVEVDAHELREALDVAVNRTRIRFGDSIRSEVSFEDDMALVGDASRLFSGFRDVSGLEHLDTSKVTDMSGMFRWCRNLTSLDLSGWDTSNVINMDEMFGFCIGLESLDVSGLNTSKVVSMEDMFKHCRSLTSLDLSGWNISNVTDMTHMFDDCRKLEDLNLDGWNTSNVTSMEDMFAYCESLKSFDLSEFDMSNVKCTRSMFYNCSSLESVDAHGVDFSNLSDGYHMFRNCNSLEDVDVTGVSSNFWCVFPKSPYVESEMLTDDGDILPVRIECFGNGNWYREENEAVWKVSWEDGGGYESGSTFMSHKDINEKIKAAEEAKTFEPQVRSFGGRDTSFVGNGQVLGDSSDVPKNLGDLGE